MKKENTSFTKNKLYLVISTTDWDNGIGDPMTEETPSCIFETKELAEAYIKAYSNDHVYDRPYSELHTGGLIIQELPYFKIGTSKELQNEFFKNTEVW